MLCRTALWVRGGAFCAGFLPIFRPESCVASFCACFKPFFRSDCRVALFCAGKPSQIRPDCPESSFCAGKRYLYLRGTEKCSRLRGKTFPNPRGLPGVTFLRRNGVSISARKQHLFLLPPHARLPHRQTMQNPLCKDLQGTLPSKM